VTGQEFSEVDLDLLADYVGGALDGTPEEAAVARRIDEEPAWAEAAAALSAATGTVRASLASWGEAAEPMPTAVADRIATALEQEPHRPTLSLVPDESAGPRRTATRARRRWPAWAAPAAIAAGVAAVAGFGLSQADGLTDDGDSGAGTSAEAPAAAQGNAEAGPGAAALAALPLATSGTNYRGATLSAAQPPAIVASGPKATGQAQEDRAFAAQPPNPSLGRLRTPAALDECIKAIGRAHPPGVTTVEAVDLASYEGSPAAVVFFTDGSGARWVWASGPECGLAARGADTRGSAKIG
jgi:hypothetical protein